jgi:tripartite-type tricarboxylate transporter receptor subunit TctC
VTTINRSGGLPDVPSISEILPGFEASAWIGVGAPKNTPSEIIDKLNKEINAALANSNIRGRFAELSGVILGGSPAEFSKLISDEAEKWTKVIRVANVKPE